MTSASKKMIFDKAVFDSSPMGAFARAATAVTGREMSDFDALWRWSVEDPEGFWALVWDVFDIPASTPYESVLAGELPNARWFTGATLNYTDLVLRHTDLPGAAVVAVAEDGSRHELTWPDLASQVYAFAATLRSLGVERGDRVVGYLTAGVEAVVAFLATASVGAIWAACAPDYGLRAAQDRLAQLTPKVLVATTGYAFGGTRYDRRGVINDLVPALGNPAVVEVPRLGLSLDRPHCTWADAVASTARPEPSEQVASDHPLWVLFSSGTTGIPKGLVHSHAGVVSVHLTTLGLHLGLGRGDRLFWYSTLNWMMWNFAVSCLTVGATLVTYEGSPTYPTADRLWAVAAGEHVAVLGVSPGYLRTCADAGCRPGAEHDLRQLRLLGATGSPLPPTMNDWVAHAISESLTVASTSGGTDVVSALLGWSPGLPVRPGELAGPILGVAVDVWDPAGRPIVEEVGELVVTRPLPSMPVTLWNDASRERYEATYFDVFRGIWRQGDWATRHRHGGFTIHGRSDSTLNRGGIRLGSADVYAIVEAFPEVSEALVLGVELPNGEYRMPMFLVLDGEGCLDDDLVARIRSALRAEASPRHVPDEIHAVAAIPHTKTGKKLEVPLKRILQGATPADVVSPDAVDDVTLLDDYVNLAARWRA